MTHLLTAVAVGALAAAIAAPKAEADTRLLRFPDIHGDQVVFVHGGDLWLASTEGGPARRLTSHAGLELFPKFSPDGGHIAFTAQYGGDEQVYVIPVEGGEPAQLTWYPSQGPLPARWGYDAQVYGWTPDGQSVIFRSMRDGFDLTDSQLFTVSVDGGLPQALPMPISGAGDISPDGSEVLYSPLFRDFRTWKRYEGGWAQDLHLFDLETNTSRNITNHVRTDRDPMWIGSDMYFASDRSDFLNLYRYDRQSGEAAAITSHEGVDVRWPSTDGVNRIVYELSGQLRILNVETGDDTAITITVADDAGLDRAHRLEVGGRVNGFDVSPNGARMSATARGELFSVPVEDGVTRNLSNTPGAHEREAAWSPDGTQIAYISDETGEEELWVRDAAGVEPPRQVTSGSSIRYFSPVWSPDGAHIALGGAYGQIWIVDMDDGRMRLAGDDRGFAVHDFSWSPDSRWLAYSSAEDNDFRSLYLYDVENGETRKLTDEAFSEYNPVFSPSGEHLFFLSDRSFAPQIGAFEWNYALDRETGVYAFALTEDASNPFLPKNDEAVVDDEDEDADENGDEAPTVEIDLDGLTDRVIRAPIEFDNYGGLSVTDSHILYVRSGPFYYGRSSDIDASLEAFNIEEREAKTLVSGIQGYALTADGSHVIVRKDGGFQRLKVQDQPQEPVAISTADMEALRVPSAEFAAIFDEVWRRFRDYFYVENMHGYDWAAIREQYRPLVDDVAHRSDLNYLMGEMIGELNAGHAYVQGGEEDLPDRPQTALLGARLALENGRYRITEIFEGDNAEPRYRSPLNEVGVNVSEGDYILAINGRPLTADTNPYALLSGGSDQLVELRVASRADGRDARNVVIEPLSSENNLLYLRWVEANRARVDAATDGRVGYLHIPDMGASGIYEWIKHFYGNMRKEGLVIDVRGNGGGNVSQMLINRLSRDLLFTGYARGIDVPDSYPDQVFVGPMAAILDEDSASDGDIFPAAFQAAGLGPLIGKRSWGGVIGITSHGPLLDDGAVFVPQFGFADAQGRWTIEGYGVDPDIEVDNPPEALLAGEDPQLQRAIEEVLRQMQTQPTRLPAPEADPVRTPGQ